MDLVTFEEIKNFLGLEQESVDNYPALPMIMDSVFAQIEDYLGRYLEYKKRTETVRVFKSNSIALKALPIYSVESVTLNGSTYSGTEIGDFGLDLGGVVDDARFTVVYKGGLKTVPAWLKAAALYQVVYEFQNKDHVGTDYVQTDGGTVGRPALSLLKYVKEKLNPYRHALVKFN